MLVFGYKISDLFPFLAIYAVRPKLLKMAIIGFTLVAQNFPIEHRSFLSPFVKRRGLEITTDY